jgi:hypothetical protein
LNPIYGQTKFYKKPKRITSGEYEYVQYGEGLNTYKVLVKGPEITNPVTNPELDSIPTLTIYQSDLDTNDYKDLFTLWNNVPVSKWSWYDKFITDANNNGIVDMVGYSDYDHDLEFEHSIYEFNKTTGNFDFKVKFPFNNQLMFLGGADFNNNGLMEILIQHFMCISFYHQSNTSYEQSDINSFPTVAIGDFHEELQNQWGTIADFNQNGYPDYAHTFDSNIEIKIIEYDPIKQKMAEIGRIFHNFQEGDHIQKLESCDINGNGLPDLLSGGSMGKVVIHEMDKNYNIIILSINQMDFWNAYCINTLTESENPAEVRIVVGGAQFSFPDWWLYPINIFKIENKKLIPIYRINIITKSWNEGSHHMNVGDIDNDGINEILYQFATHIYIFKKENDDEDYNLFYYKYEKMFYDEFIHEIAGVEFVDFDKDGCSELLINKNTYDNGKIFFSTHVYKLNK